jgi:Phage terminase large subunit (GpA)
MRKIDLSFMLGAYLACFTPRPTKRPSQWCVENVEFNEAGNHGPFRLDGCEYIAEVVDDWGNPDVHDEVLVFGSQTRKTGSLMGGACWAIINDPSGFLWVMPSLTLARKFTTQRLKRMILKSPGTQGLVPTGARRHEVSALSMMLGPSTLNFVGSNSAANLSSNPCRRVVLDEVDKFDAGGREEADAVNLAEQRTKDQPNPQRWKTSTPTLVSGLIWQEYLKGDQRRYFVPCPSCSKLVVFAWSKQFTVMPVDGCEAFVRWDPEARRDDGTWDLEKVSRSAHLVCPHCEGKILDGHKTAMVKAGQWISTNPNSAAGFVSRHLPSLYASSPETTFGALALKFLQNKRSLLGLQGFINGDLAEPYQSQDLSNERTELIRTAQVEITAEWKGLLSADAQQTWPYIWFVKRMWNGGDSEGIVCGHCDTFEELRAIQLAPGATIPDTGVVIDSGFGSKREAEVYRNCTSYCQVVPRKVGIPLLVGWMPSKGMPGRKRWRDPDTKLFVPWYLRAMDPFMGTTQAAQVETCLFEFSASYFEDILEGLRAGKGGFKWAVSAAMDTYKSENGSTYWRHMDGHIKVNFESRMTGIVKQEWKLRHRTWPDHLLDCEILQVAKANFHQFFSVETESKNANQSTANHPQGHRADARGKPAPGSAQ